MESTIGNRQANQSEEIVEAIGRYRSLILDVCEQEMGESPRWKFLRSRLLKYLGGRGLEEEIVKISINWNGGEHGKHTS